MARTARITRKTNETDITVSVDLDGTGAGSRSTGIPFFDHMLDHLARHSLIDLTVDAKGDVEIDGHHTVEDVALTIGQALVQALGDKKGIVRYGFSSIPMNETLAEASLDISGRPYCVFTADLPKGKAGDFDVELAEEFFRGFANAAGLTLHLTVRYGTNLHHIVEALFKAAARSLGEAVRLDPRIAGIVPSTKGSL